MAVGGINKWTPPRNATGIPRVSTRFSRRVENEQANARREGRTCVAKFSGASGDRGKKLFPVQLATSRIGNVTRLINSLPL